jgi:hypothetical protein
MRSSRHLFQPYPRVADHQCISESCSNTSPLKESGRGASSRRNPAERRHGRFMAIPKPLGLQPHWFPVPHIPRMASPLAALWSAARWTGQRSSTSNCLPCLLIERMFSPERESWGLLQKGWAAAAFSWGVFCKETHSETGQLFATSLNTTLYRRRVTADKPCYVFI